MRMFWAILRQSIVLAFRKGGGGYGVMGFYLVTMTLFTFALGPVGIRQYAGAAMSVTLLLSVITALPLLFERDYEDGTLEQFLLQPVLLEILVLAKILGQWVASALPVLLVSPLLAMMSGMEWRQALLEFLLLMLASPSIVAIGAIGAALTLGNRRGGLLQALLVMPLYVPILIFTSAAEGQGAVLFMAGLLFASLPLSCMVCASLIRASQE